MDFLTAVNIIGKDLEEALTSLEQLSGISGSDKAEIELARSRIGSAASLVRLLPSLSGAPDEKEAVTGTAEAAPARETAPKADPAEDTIRKVASAENATRKVSQAVTGAEVTYPEEEATQKVTPAEEAASKAAPEEEATRKVTAVVTKATATDPAEETTQKVSQAEAKTAVTDQAVAGTAATDPSEARATETKPVKGEPKSPEHSKAILADRFTSGGALVDKMQTEKKEEVISSVMKSKPVSDIAAAIGINDRFYFIRELFSGDALAYNDTIKRLNAAASLGEAMRILDESTVMGSDPAAQSSFVDVVRRKFSLHV
ncbi:MAG: hypothetical protein GT599_05370 [Bacteroidales bacterium]|nr:hypothetical protein [Bacteroidales bacterium]